MVARLALVVMVVMAMVVVRPWPVAMALVVPVTSASPEPVVFQHSGAVLRAQAPPMGFEGPAVVAQAAKEVAQAPEKKLGEKKEQKGLPVVDGRQSEDGGHDGVPDEHHQKDGQGHYGQGQQDGA
jgi:hypothetical protein